MDFAQTDLMNSLSLMASVLGGLGIAALVLIGILVLLAVFGVGQYNSLVKLRNRYRNAFAQIDVQLKRRYDLIPNLVETAKSFMKHERETLEAVIKARNVAVSAQSNAKPENAEDMEKLAAAEGGLEGVLSRFIALSENYPELRSNKNMMQLSEELTSTENKVAFSRQSYNDAVTTYNTKRESFPGNVFASLCNFGSAVLFEVWDEEQRKAVKVDFD